MRVVAVLFLAFFAFAAVPASAQSAVVAEWIEEWDEAAQRWVRVLPQRPVAAAPTAERVIAVSAARVPGAVAAFGPFRVIDKRTAALVGVTGSATPREFRAMLRTYPRLARLDLVECPGTDDDRANLAVGRMIRAAGLETRVPAGGSVRSGAVELFLAGARRTVEDGAQFAVHSWMDERGLEADDYDANAPEHGLYLAYYREMGMDAERARAFYDMTNSVPHEQALWLGAQDMRAWLGDTPADTVDAPPPRLAYLDFEATSF